MKPCAENFFVFFFFLFFSNNIQTRGSDTKNTKTQHKTRESNSETNVFNFRTYNQGVKDLVSNTTHLLMQRLVLCRGGVGVWGPVLQGIQLLVDIHGERNVWN